MKKTIIMSFKEQSLSPATLEKAIEGLAKESSGTTLTIEHVDKPDLQ